MTRLASLLLCALLTWALPTPAHAESPEAFIQASLATMQQQAEAHAAQWGLGKAKRWSADLSRGVLSFEFADGRRVEAPLQVVGTYDTETASFQWGWDHAAVPPALRQHAELARQWGERESLPKFNTRVVRCGEEEAWAFAAVASRLGGAKGVYRGYSGTVRLFVTFGEVSISRPPGK